LESLDFLLWQLLSATRFMRLARNGFGGCRFVQRT
jgi:hypothetical protein